MTCDRRAGIPWLRFDCAAWLMGKIQRLPLEAHGLFVHFCICNATTGGAFRIDAPDLAERYKVGVEWIEATVAEFERRGILVRGGGQNGDAVYAIKFVSEQIESYAQRRAGWSRGGKTRAKALWAGESGAGGGDADGVPSDADLEAAGNSLPVPAPPRPIHPGASLGTATSAIAAMNPTAERVSALRAVVNEMYGRKSVELLSYQEERDALAIVQSGGGTSEEVGVLRRWLQWARANDGKPPQKRATMLSGWAGNVDRARSWDRGRAGKRRSGGAVPSGARAEQEDAFARALRECLRALSEAKALEGGGCADAVGDCLRGLRDKYADAPRLDGVHPIDEALERLTLARNAPTGRCGGMSPPAGGSTGGCHVD